MSCLVWGQLKTETRALAQAFYFGKVSQVTEEEEVQRNRDKGKEGTPNEGELLGQCSPPGLWQTISAPQHCLPTPGPDPEEESVYPLAPVAGWSRVPQG